MSERKKAWRGVAVLAFAAALSVVVATLNSRHWKSRLDEKVAGHLELPKSVTITGVDVDLDLTPHLKAYGSVPDLVLKDVHLPSWYKFSEWPSAHVVPSADDYKTFLANEKEFQQNHIDKEAHILTKHLFNGVRNGLVLEMGANDGKSISVSRPLESLFGWRSVLLEAEPSKAQEMRKWRPDAIRINAAVCGTPRMVHFSSTVGQPGGGRTGAVVELVKDEAFLRSYHSHTVKDGKLLYGKELTEVMCVPLGPILKALGIRHIDFMMLDCEGCEEEAVKSMDLDEVTVDVIALESDSLQNKATTRADRFIEMMSNAGKRETYEVWQRQLGKNTWFVRKGFVPLPSPSGQ